MLDPQPVLAGRRVLVVEDEYVIATELAAFLTMHGAKVLGPAATVAQARHVLAKASQPDTAILDINLGGDVVWPIAELLMDAGVRLVLATGYDAGGIPRRFNHLPRCEKPESPESLLGMLTHSLTGDPEAGVR